MTLFSTKECCPSILGFFTRTGWTKQTVATNNITMVTELSTGVIQQTVEGALDFFQNRMFRQFRFSKFDIFPILPKYSRRIIWIYSIKILYKI